MPTSHPSAGFGDAEAAAAPGVTFHKQKRKRMKGRLSIFGTDIFP
jgi:hypothetical protein